MSELKTSLLFFYTETALHAGSGAGVGAIDLPLQRERMSELPQVQGSGVKGALRELFRAPDDDPSRRALEDALFGPRPPDPNDDKSETGAKAHEHAGALAVTDARLLLLPVRTARGGWAWITSALILQRLARDLSCTNGHAQTDVPAWATLAVGSDKALIASADAAIHSDDHLIIEDAAYATMVDKRLEQLANFIVKGLPGSPVYEPVRRRLVKQLAVVSDEEMCYWARHATEIVTRVRINSKTGTVSEGALWTEEALPSETLLWSTVMIAESRKRDDNRRAAALETAFVKGIAARSRIFLGGDRSVGRGLVALGQIGAS